MLLYARLDVVIKNDELLVMELELIEPHLFFEFNAKSAVSLADEIIKLIS